MTDFKTNSGGVWLAPTISAKHSGAWKSVKQHWRNISGTWVSFYVQTITLAFTSSLVGQQTNLSSYVDPASGDYFDIYINSGVTLSGASGATGYTGGTGSNGGSGANGSNSHSNEYGKTGGKGGTGGTGGAGGAAGYALNLSGFSGKTVNLYILGALTGGQGGHGGQGGRGGTGGRGGNGASFLGYSGGHSTGRGAGGAGGNGGAPGAGAAGTPALTGTSGVTINVMAGGYSNGASGSNYGYGPTGYTGSVGSYGYHTNLANSCFIAGEMVLMSDGSYLPIEDVQVNDYVMDAYGNPQRVMYLDRPLRGDRPIYSLNDRLFFTSEHTIMNADRTGFLILDMDLYDTTEVGTLQEVIDGNGSRLMMEMTGIRRELTQMEQLAVGTEVAVIEGSAIVHSLVETDKTDAQLYNLVIDGSATYYVNGVAVTGFGNDKRFDYTNQRMRIN